MPNNGTPTRLQQEINAKHFYMYVCILLIPGCYTCGIYLIDHFVFKSEGQHLNVSTTFWTEETIAYWVNFDPIPPFNSHDVKRYNNELYIKQEAQLRALKCIPKEGVFRVDNLILERNISLPSPLIPEQKIVLKRCLPQSSFCETFGMKCKPTKLKRKSITVFLKNQNTTTSLREDGREFEDMMNMVVNGTASIFNILVEEHGDCACQCLCSAIKTDST